MFNLVHIQIWALPYLTLGPVMPSKKGRLLINCTACCVAKYIHSPRQP